MGRIGPNEVRGGPNRVSAQRRRRLCRALRGALCGGLREGVRGYAGVCGGVECVGTGRVAGRLRGRVLRGEGYRDGGRTGRSGGRGGGTKGCGSGRGGCREPTAGIAVWMVWGVSRGRATVGGVVGPFAARYDRFFLLGGRPFAAVSPFIGSGPLQRCWQAFLGLNNPLPRCGAGFSRTGGDVLWRGPRYRSAAVSCAQR